MLSSETPHLLQGTLLCSATTENSEAGQRGLFAAFPTLSLASIVLSRVSFVLDERKSEHQTLAVGARINTDNCTTSQQKHVYAKRVLVHICTTLRASVAWYGYDTGSVPQ